MTNLSTDVEALPLSALVAAVMTAGAERSPASRHAERVATRLLADLGGIAGLARMTQQELEERLAATPTLRVQPAGCARALAAAFEIARRLADATRSPLRIRTSADVATWGSARLGTLDHEELWLLALDGRSRVRAERCVAKGGLHGVGVRPSDPLRFALRASASAFVLVHNHPSGDPAPSPEDVDFTSRVAQAAAVVGVPLLDHVVVGAGAFSCVPFESTPFAEVSASLGPAA